MKKKAFLKVVSLLLALLMFLSPNLLVNAIGYHDEYEDILLTLYDIKGDLVSKTLINGYPEGKYVFAVLDDGEYTVIVSVESKNCYVPRTYNLTAVDGKLSCEYKICRFGDINEDGKVNTIDVARVNAHIRNCAQLSGYSLECADVTGDGIVDIIDVSRMDIHARGIKSMWDSEWESDPTEKVTIFIIPDKTSTKIGDEVTYTISAKYTGKISSFYMDIDFPKGVKYVEKSGVVDENALDLLGSQFIDWIHSDQTINDTNNVSGFANEPATFKEEVIIARFKGVIKEEGQHTVSVKNVVVGDGNFCRIPSERVDIRTERTDVENIGDVEPTNVKFVQGDKGKEVSGFVEVSFKQSWFSKDSLVYNHDLARLCSQFAMIGYDNPESKTNKPYLNKALVTIGMDPNSIRMDAKADKDKVNYFIACREIEVDRKEYNLIFVGLIGSYHEQWYSNFDPGKGSTHKGFLSAKNYVYNALENYFEEYGFSKNTTKILITGHSRGSAASNLLAADLIKNENLACAENVYTYAFATPNSTSLPERTEGRFLRIFNIVNPEDFVTKCMPAKWGHYYSDGQFHNYGRYGKTFVLPSKSNEKYNTYKEYKNNMQKFYSDFTYGRKYTPYAGGESETYGVVKAMTNKVKNIEEFYEKGFYTGDGTVTFSIHEFFENTLCHIVSKVATPLQWTNTVWYLLCIITMQTASPLLKTIVTYFVANGTDLHACFEEAHMAETYCAYMMSMTEKQLTNPFRFSYRDSINCPVDVTVIDKETGEVVGKIVNNVIDEEVAAKENSVVAVVEGDSKTFWLPSNGDYEVVLTGNDNGTMDHTVSKIDSDLGETERANFYNVEVIKDGSYNTEFSSENFALDNYSLSSEDEEVIKADEMISGDGLQTLEINVAVEGDGSTTESMTVTTGDYVKLVATPELSGEFLGWYENDELVTIEETYSFVAKENKDITAKFTIVPVKLKGTVTAPEDSGVFVYLMQESEIIKTTLAVDGEYSFKGVEGEYSLRFVSSKCTTREYEVTAGEGDEAIIVDASINYIGDINGDNKITLIDYSQALKHVKKTGVIEGYAYNCADINADGKITVIDYTSILKHVKKTDSLW